MSATIVAEGLGKRYRLGESAQAYVTLRETLARRLRRHESDGSRGDEIWALRDVDLAIEEGDAVGIIGRNGAGKTTFLKTVARIVQPTTGSVRVRGRVGALLEVGTGFHPELTGRENVYLNGVILGMSRRDVRRRFDDIVEFAGIERFLDTPLKRYSSGMYLRLAFSVAAHIDPDVVIVDEVLAVGDAEFRKRCLGRMSEFGREGRTVLFVSHDTGVVGQLCRSAVWLEQGRVQAVGPTHDILDRYLRSTVRSHSSVDVPFDARHTLQRLSLAMVDAAGRTVDSPRRDDTLTFELRVDAKEALAGIDAAIYLRNLAGVRVVNENLSDVASDLTGPPGRFRVRLTIPPMLAADDYVVGVWLGTSEALLFKGELMRFSVRPLPDERLESVHGVARPAVRWDVEHEPWTAVPSSPTEADNTRW
jgi:ABC-type polysaccharide/polyol phosphate transport system ATPase subunit